MSRWDGELSSAALSIAKELSKTNKVYYFDYPYTAKDYWKNRHTEAVQRRKSALLRRQNIYTEVEAGNENLLAVTPPLMLPFSFLPSGFLYNKALDINNDRLFASIGQVLSDNDISDFIFINSFNPFYAFDWRLQQKPRMHIYQCRDNIRAIPFWAEQGPRLERLAATAADLRMATSSQLVEILEKETGLKVHLLPNAAEVELFKTVQKNSFEVPEELKENKLPVVAYVGHIGPRLNFDLLNKVVRDHADKLFLMLGPIGSSKEDVEELKKLPNVVFTGPKRLEEIPRYLKFTDCSIIPFVKNELTRSIYPLKLNEHLAAGKAIVTTDFSKDVQEFEDVVYISENAEEFSTNISKAVTDNAESTREKRLKRVEQNSWKQRVEKFWNLLEHNTETTGAYEKHA